jgi:hypothetical protein
MDTQADTQLDTHDCAAPGCDTQVPAGKLMCYGHWFQLPAHIRRRVTGRYLAWMRAQGDAEKFAAYERVRGEAIRALS